MSTDDQLRDSKRSPMTAGTPYTETEEDSEDLRLMHHFHQELFHGGEPPTEILEAKFLQTLEKYRTSGRKSDETHHFTSVTDPADEDGIEGTSESRFSNTPEESSGLQLCHWVDQFTNQTCRDSVPAGKKAMLSHLKVKHGVHGSERERVVCRWAFPSGSRAIGVCGKESQRRNIPRHIAAHLHLRVFCTYPGCDKDFARSDLVVEHLRNVHKVEKVTST